MEFSHHGKLQYSDAASSGEARSAFRIKNWKEVSIYVTYVFHVPKYHEKIRFEVQWTLDCPNPSGHSR